MADEKLHLAHIVYPAAKIEEIFKGSKQRVKALCGAMISQGDSRESRNPICRSCFNEYDKLDLVDGAPGTAKTAPPLPGASAPSDA